ncbi:MAG: hypothetical protein ACLR8P_06865 [Clostridium fessum]
MGAFAISLVTNEYKATAGSPPMIRFVHQIAIMVIGALVFLGCPLRMVLRMAAGDLNAYVALVSCRRYCNWFVLPEKGFSLGRAYETQKSSGYVLPVLLLALFIIGALTGVYAASTEGPEASAPVLISQLRLS